MLTFEEFLNESELLESKDGIEISSVQGRELMGKKAKSIIKKGSKVWKQINGEHTIQRKNTSYLPCEVVKIEKKKNKKTGKVDIWISAKSTDDHGKESYFYDWASQFMNAMD